MDVIELLEANPEADVTKLGLIAYACTPCENCRRDAARILHESSIAPGWLIEECRFDSAEECRKLAAVVAEPPDPEIE